MMTHEGAFPAQYMPNCGLAVLEHLSGVSSGVAGPFIDLRLEHSYQALQPFRSAVINAAAETVAGGGQGGIGA